MKITIKATMETHLITTIEADSVEAAEEMIRKGEIDGGGMVEDGEGSWIWGDVQEAKTA
ncbi:MAG: hypothetical protein QM500_19465 [Methylococcales bacterium]